MVVIDLGISVYVGEMVLKKISTVTDAPVIAVFNTHIHGDHWLANHAIKRAFPEAVIYAHPKMKARVEAGEGDMWLRRFNEMTKGALEGTRIVIPDVTVTNGEIVGLGGTE
ncbi:MAG: MBL fold metallo-hydrolase, partial [Aestuariibacter sp.]|nr:MBL fold metallo-hydrolase [Aestuariibacter sp.]